MAAGLISPLEAYGDEAADKLAARGALRNAFSMEYGAATRNTDRRVRLVQTRLVEMNLLHVQNRLCFLRGERTFLKQLLGKPCSATSRSVFPLPAPVSTPTPDEPESVRLEWRF